MKIQHTNAIYCQVMASVFHIVLQCCPSLSEYCSVWPTYVLPHDGKTSKTTPTCHLNFTFMVYGTGSCLSEETACYFAMFWHVPLLLSWQVIKPATNIRVDFFFFLHEVALGPLELQIGNCQLRYLNATAQQPNVTTQTCIDSTKFFLE